MSILSYRVGTNGGWQQLSYDFTVHRRIYCKKMKRAKHLPDVTRRRMPKASSLFPPHFNALFLNILIQRMSFFLHILSKSKMWICIAFFGKRWQLASCRHTLLQCIWIMGAFNKLQLIYFFFLLFFVPKESWK